MSLAEIEETQETSSGEHAEQPAAAPSNSDFIIVSDEETTANVGEGQASETASELSAHAGQLRRASKQKMIARLIAALVIGAMIAVGALLLKKEHASASQNGSAGNHSASAVSQLSPEQQAHIEVEVVQQRRLPSELAVTGKVSFNGDLVTPVFSQFSGRLIKLNAEVGSTVKAGQALGTIDTPDIIATQADYQQAISAERSANTSLELAKRTRERATRLAAVEAIPQRELQQAQADEAHAADELQRAHSAAVAARGRLQSAGMSAAEIESLALNSHPINRLVPLVAPISGTVIERKAGPGQIVQAGTGDPLLIIADLSTVWINADVYEDQLGSLRRGALAKIQTAAYPNEIFAARVDQIGATLDPDKHTVAVRCVVINRGDKLKPGMFVNVSLGSRTPQTALTVPSTAIVSEGDHRIVYVEDAPGSYTKRTIEVGAEEQGTVLVRAGLRDGERVVVHGALLIGGNQ